MITVRISIARPLMSLRSHVFNWFIPGVFKLGFVIIVFLTPMNELTSFAHHVFIAGKSTPLYFILLFLSVSIFYFVASLILC